MERDRGLSYLIKQLELAVRRPFVDVVNIHGMNSAQYTALSVLVRRPGLTSSELARRSFVRPQTMAETITILLEAGLVRREQDPDHGRQRLLFITDEGIARLSAMSHDVRDVEDRMLRGFSNAEVEQLRSYLRRCTEALGQTDDDSV